MWPYLGEAGLRKIVQFQTISKSLSFWNIGNALNSFKFRPFGIIHRTTASSFKIFAMNCLPTSMNSSTASINWLSKNIKYRSYPVMINVGNRSKSQVCYGLLSQGTCSWHFLTVFTHQKWHFFILIFLCIVLDWQGSVLFDWSLWCNVGFSSGGC